jgi:hypothetical protein
MELPMNLTRVICSLCLAAGLLFELAGCASLPLAPADPLAMMPEEVVEAFYNWMLEYPGNPVADRAYQSSPYLTQAYITRVDQLFTNAETGLNADPFLFAQIVPTGFRVEAASRDENQAQVVVHEVFGDGGSTQDLTVDLIRSADEWKIDRVQPGNPLTADGVVGLFYQGLVAAAQEQASTQLSAETRYLCPDLDSASENLFAPAQGRLVGVNVYAPVIDGEQASVLVEVDGLQGEGPVNRELRQVLLERDPAAWCIDAVQADAFGPVAPDPALAVPVEDWPVYRNAALGLSIRYPAGWVTREESTPEITVEWMPADIAETYTAWRERGVQPDRTRPMQVPPFALSVIRGDRESIAEQFVWAGEEREASFNGYRGYIRERQGGAQIIYLPHPADAETWLFFYDQVSSDPLRADQAQASAGLLERMLATLEFTDR